MKFATLVCATLLLAFCANAHGQGPLFHPAPHFQRPDVRHYQPSFQPGLLPMGHQPFGPVYQPYQYPAYVTPNRITHIGPYGQVHTGNSQIDNTYFQYGRNQSAANGSLRNVNRPVHDSFGNIVGYQQGQVWNNSVTGQEHGNVRTVTPNGMGGTHETATMYSTAGGDITPMEGK